MVWYLGYAVEESLAIARWADEHSPGSFVSWYPFTHPQLGAVELGGADKFRLIMNPPLHLLKDEVMRHADFAVYHASLSPRIKIVLCDAVYVGDEAGTGHSIWRVRAGIVVILIALGV